MMQLIFSQLPGARERHLIRKQANPLFPEGQGLITKEQLLEAQRLDHEELLEFITRFKTLVHQVVNLPPHADGETILSIKEQLDQAYEQASGLADDQQETKQAAEKLTGVIMQAIRKEAGSDTVALQELAQETEARKAHYELLHYPLVADILNPDSPIQEGELAATLLSASEVELIAALGLFDQDQRAILTREAQVLIEATAELPEAIKLRLSTLSG